jgi:hypothetical protein
MSSKEEDEKEGHETKRETWEGEGRRSKRNNRG